MRVGSDADGLILFGKDQHELGVELVHHQQLLLYKHLDNIHKYCQSSTMPNLHLTIIDR